ncbi:MAG TPA: galactose-1-epimerase, partial [Chryseolinea sp.]
MTKPQSQQAKLLTLKNKNGVEMTVTDFGARVITLKVPDKNGTSVDIVLGYDTPQEYIGGHPCFGALVGRYANRISKGSLWLENQHY